MTYADGHLYCYSELDGTAALVQATPDSYKEDGRFTMPQLVGDRRGKVWTHPVVANGRLYLRNQDQLLCFDVKSGS